MSFLADLLASIGGEEDSTADDLLSLIASKKGATSVTSPMEPTASSRTSNQAFQTSSRTDRPTNDDLWSGLDRIGEMLGDFYSKDNIGRGLEIAGKKLGDFYTKENVERGLNRYNTILEHFRPTQPRGQAILDLLGGGPALDNSTRELDNSTPEIAQLLREIARDDPSESSNGINDVIGQVREAKMGGGPISVTMKGNAGVTARDQGAKARPGFSRTSSDNAANVRARALATQRQREIEKSRAPENKMKVITELLKSDGFIQALGKRGEPPEDFIRRLITTLKDL